MSTSQPKSPPHTAQINDHLITLLPKETVLEAALRNALPFPNSCHVGGCGACKCRLVEGEVKELTETGYLLSAEELERGYILGCQSVPKTDVRIEVEFAKPTAKRTVGRVIGRYKVTHDITHLTVQLEEPLQYQAGQYAEVAFEELPGVVRPYSFAAPPRADGVVEFYVRKVPQGQMSSFIHDRAAVGAAVTVAGPVGEFWLRPGEAPLVMVAGGSGLPPILAMLEQAAAEGVTRPVTLLFGARDEQDLYALERIERLAQRWNGAFRFIPVLSAARASSRWTGARGLVASQLERWVEPGAHAYLCGPPAMIDGALEVLRAGGVRGEHIYFDRFTSAADATAIACPALPPAAQERAHPVRDVLHYGKYFLFHAVGLAAVGAILGGGWITTLGLLAILAFYVVGDAISGDDTSTPTFRYPGVLTAGLWLALPLLGLVVFSAVWSVSPGDPLGFGAWVTGVSGYDVLAARQSATVGQQVAGWILTGLMIGMTGTIPGHELTHRTWDSASMVIGRWLLAFSFDTSFSIEHVYGHHRYVSTGEDPATAPRGRNVYFHILASTWRGNLSAWRIEQARLGKRRLPVWSLHNRFLRGHAMSVGLLGLAAAIGGSYGALYFAACALWGKALLEIVNYMEHYGLVRDPATPVQPRHSWNTNRRLSSWTLFNLTRHSHHHAQGEVPYQELRPYPDAPMMLGGYLTTLVVALIPPLWHHLMTPRVLAWDLHYATQEERALAAIANAHSGLRFGRAAGLASAPLAHHLG